MYVITETKISSKSGSFNVGYYKPDGEFYTEESFSYLSNSPYGCFEHETKDYCRREARELCSELNGGR